MSSEGMRSDNDSPRRNPRRLSRRETKIALKRQRKLHKNITKLGLDSSPDVEKSDKAQREPKAPSYRESQKLRKCQHKLNKNLGKVNLNHTLDDASSVGAVKDTSETDAVVETRGPWRSEPIPLAFEEMKPWETPPAKKASLFAHLDKAHEGYPITKSGTIVKLTVFFEEYEDNRSRALPPIRQDGTPVKELVDIPSIRNKVERLYLLQFRMMNFDHAVDPEAYQTSSIAEWSDFKVRGVRFSYTDYSNTRIQLPLIKTPEAINEHADFAVAEAFAFPCHCGGFYCRAYNHPIELMVIYEAMPYLDERLELRMEALQKRKAVAERAREEAAEVNEGEGSVNEVGSDESEAYEESSSLEEEGEKVVGPGRREAVRTRGTKAVSSEESEVEEEPETGVDEAETEAEEDEIHQGDSAALKGLSSTINQSGASGVWDAQIQGLKKGEEAGEIDAANFAAIKEALGEEPRRARSARRG